MLITDSSGLDHLAWEKMGGMIPAIVQDSFDGRVLMQGYMNREAAEYTLQSGLVSFWSRSRKTRWTKGETSGNTLQLQSIAADCDFDCLLVMATPNGPTCHRNTDTCFDDSSRVAPDLAFLAGLERLVSEREAERPKGSYTTHLFDAGTKRIAQKVGEEGVETALAAVAGDRDELLNESADLLFHLLVLLKAGDAKLADVIGILQTRHAE